MEFETFSIAGLVLVKPKVFEDHRGFFFEAYHQQRFEDHGINTPFVQDNHSRSSKHTLRGLHYQVNRGQAKLVRCLQGEIFDVAVDIRPESPTYGQWQGATLSAENKHQLFVPVGFAHGFLVTSDSAEVLYKCSDFYSPKDERGLMWNDSTLSIEWPLTAEPLLSAKDQAHPSFTDIRLS